MKKYILVWCTVFWAAFSASAWAVTPDAVSLSGEQELAVKWVDAMLAKQQPAEALKIMSKESRQNLKIEEMNTLSADIARTLGKLKGIQFVSWSRMPQTDNMIYLMSFEKEKLVRCLLVFDKEGQLYNFALTPLKEEKQEKKDAK